MATPEEVEETLLDLSRRFERIDRSYLAMLPNHRTVEAEFPDIERYYHVEWRDGALSELRSGPADKPHVRISCTSDDLLAMANGELSFRRAYATNRLRLVASMTDLLRLRSVL